MPETFKRSFKIKFTFSVLHPAAKADDPIDSKGDSNDSEGVVGLVDVSEVQPLIFDTRVVDKMPNKLLCDIRVGH